LCRVTLTRGAGQDGSALPVLVAYTGEVLVDPPNDRVAAVFGLAGLPAGTVDAADWTLPRPPFPLETNMPGAFAAGDVRHGSVKRVASAVGEGSIATTQLTQYLQSQPRSSHLPAG
jgi:NADPH-dependent glutamate synthase beta subunit-like oxidoreductase